MSATSKIDGSTWGRAFYVLLALSAALTLLLVYSVVDPKDGGRQPDSAMPRFDLTGDDVDGLTIFLAGQRRLRIVDQKLPATIARRDIAVDASATKPERGKALFAVRGCGGCHSLRTGPDSLLGQRQCPELTYAGRMRGKDYIGQHLLDPKKDVADSIMPPFDFLPDTERGAIVAYLMTSPYVPAVEEELGPEQVAAIRFGTLCASCHGETGNGLGPIAAALDPKPKNFQKKGFVAAYADRFADRILGGVPGTAMPPWEKILSPEDVEAIVDLIESDFARLGDADYAREERDAPAVVEPAKAFDAYLRGREVFATYCAGCHGRLGTGKGANAYDLLELGRKSPDGDFQGEMLPRNLRNLGYYGETGVLERRRIYNSIRLGVPGTAMPPWDRGLSQEQIRDVVEFVLEINNREFQQRAKEAK